MARPLVIIGDGRGDVHIAATPDAAGLLGRLQRRYPRELRVLHEEPDAGGLAVKVHEHLAAHRLRGDWFELADGVDHVRRVIADVDDRHHNHEGPPSNSAYSNGCRHPACRDERAAYTRELLDRRRRGDWSDRRKMAQPPRPWAAERAVDHAPAPAEVQAVQAGQLAEDPAEHPEDHGPGYETGPARQVEVPSVPAPPESRPSDQSLVLAYFHKFAMPDGRIHRAMNNLDLMATMTPLRTDRCKEIAAAMLETGQLRQDGEDLYLVVAA